MTRSAPDPYVFLSYSRMDRGFVDRLVADLGNAGVDTWRDIEQIEPGANWRDAIEDGLLGATALVYVASQNAVESSFMEQELETALMRGRPVIPILLDDVSPDSLPQAIRDRNWIDFRTGYAVGLRTLLSTFPTLLRGEPVETKDEVSKGYVFVSYAEEDSAFVRKLKQSLSNYGYAYWDYRESDRDYQQQLFLELEGVIKEAAATLSVLSPAWKRSGVATKEFLFAEEVGNPVFLLRTQPLEPTLAIAGRAYIDFVEDEDAGFRELHRELKKKGL